MSTKQIVASCKGSGTLPLAAISPLQGKLKSLSREAFAKLRSLIVKNGITSPVHIWTDEKGRHWNLDGHQRVNVLGALGKEGFKIPPIPVVNVQAKNLKHAKEILLSNVAQFGRVDEEGLFEFMNQSEISFPELVGGFDIPWLDLKDFGQEYFEHDSKKGDEIYSKKIEAPIYEPRGDKPPISELYSQAKLIELLAEIEASKVSEEEKAFLRFAAHRHVVFDYEKIAEFYAHAPKKLQLLMESSALVIIDFNKALEKGFTALSEGLAEAYASNEDISAKEARA